MSESEKPDVTTEDKPSTSDEMMEKMCRGLWRLKPSVVSRVEDDGTILFDPDTDSMAVINLTGSALLQWRRDRICFDEWCEVVHKHYKNEVDLAQVQADMKECVGKISPFAEAYDGESNQDSICP